MPRALSYRSTHPRWRPRRHLPCGRRPPALLWPWLDDSGSLTARLIELSQGQFRVQVLQQRLAIPARDEQLALQMARPALALIREVVLLGRQQPWVFARSVLPLASLVRELRHLRKQHNRPLGAFLFSQPQLQRSAIAVARFSGDDNYVPRTLRGTYPLWGRRSVFSLGGKPLLVSEVFLPAFCAQLDDAQDA